MVGGGGMITWEDQPTVIESRLGDSGGNDMLKVGVEDYEVSLLFKLGYLI